MLTDAIRPGSVSMVGEMCIGITGIVDNGKSVAEEEAKPNATD